MNNSISTKSIHELLSEKFYIPNYQRGYRWTKFEVKKLVDDLYRYFQENSNGEQSYYCLQPLVVRKREDKESWELIDGQQRMTTLFLLLKYLYFRMDEIEKDSETKAKFDEYLNMVKTAFPGSCYQLFQLSYETRKESRKFLDNIDKCSSSDCKYVDYVYIYNAYEEIKEYFNNKIFSKEQLTFLLTFLFDIINDKNRVRFIWYDVTGECSDKENYSQELFSRLNIGKIPLTNAELVKSLFINDIYDQLRKTDIVDANGMAPDVVEQYYETIASQLSYRIASEWDMVEQKLNDPEFWAFIYGQEDGKYQTRIELIFDIISEKDPKEQDKYFTFSRYDEKFRTNSVSSDKNPDNLMSCKKWREIMKLFYLFCAWFENRDIYHYVGFLMYKKIPLTKIKKMYDEAADQSTFFEKLREKVFEIANVNSIDDLSYSNNPTEIRDILLIFNIESIRKTKSEERFSFNNYYTQKYDIEHIKPHTPKEYSSNKEWEGLIRSSLGYLTGCHYKDKVELSDERFESALKKYANELLREKPPLKEDPEGIANRIQRLIDKRKMVDRYSVYGTRIIKDIDEQLQRVAPEIKQSKVTEKECQKEFIKNLDKLKNPSEEKLVKKLFENYKAIVDGQEVKIDFTPEENQMLGIENDSGNDTIANLVLLDEHTNRSYKNDSFIIKRYYIQKREQEGVYVPRCTRDVFNKMYSKNVTAPMRWTDEDMKDYKEEIKRVLK